MTAVELALAGMLAVQSITWIAVDYRRWPGR